MDEHSAELVQKLLELGGNGYTFEDLRKDVESFEHETKKSWIEETEKALITPNVTKKHKKRGRRYHKELGSKIATTKGQTTITNIYKVGKGKNLPKKRWKSYPRMLEALMPLASRSS